MSGRADYEERREARIDRLETAAATASAKATAEATRSHDFVKDIPFGQPNIIGRPALPRLREKSVRAMERSIEHSETAEYYSDKAEAAKKNRAISSDDPDAAEKLEAKIEKLEAEKDRVKAFNKEARKNGTEPAPWYALPYLNRDIKAAKERIEKLRKTDDMPDETITFSDGEIKVDSDTNRVCIQYSQRPDDDTITALKANGFHWSKTESVWMRLKSPAALRAAKRVCGI